jgi:ATP-binding cassette subfamily C (CFTR/MRP) protein 1
MLMIEQVGYIGYAIIQLVLLGLLNKADTPKTSASIACSAVTFITALGLALLSHLEHSRNIRPSTLLNTFLFFTLIFDIARTRTLWGIPHNTTVAAVFLMSVLWKAILLVLESLTKRSLLYNEYKKFPPEAIVGTFDRSFFWWLNPLLLRGFKGAVTLDSLYPVDNALISNPDAFDLRDRWQDCKNLFLNLRSATNHLASDQWKDKHHTLTLVCMRHYKGMLLSAIIPRLALTGFTFCQPFLVERSIIFITQFDHANRIQIGYGLVAATAIIYIGIAVSQPSRKKESMLNTP